MFKKKVKYQSWHRGTRELDYVLGRFFDDNEDYLMSNIDECDEFLKEEDSLIYEWLFNSNNYFPPKYTKILEMIKKYHRF
jgi:antitoxin CptB